VGTDQRFYTVPLPDGTQAEFVSVTTALGVLDSRRLNTWRLSHTKEEAEAILADTGDVGSQTHAIIERIIKGEIISKDEWDALDERVRNCIRAWRRWQMRVNFKPRHAELMVYSLEHGFAGTLDSAGTTKPKRPGIQDYKTGNSVFIETAFPQIVAYKHAYLEMFPKRKVEDLIVVRLDKVTGIPEPLVVPPEEEDTHWRFFLAALNMFRMKQEQARIKGGNQ